MIEVLVPGRFVTAFAERFVWWCSEGWATGLHESAPVGRLSLEGYALVPVEGGGVVYNGVHLSLAESEGGGRDAWRRSFRQVKALGMEFVVAGRQVPARPDDAARIGRTRRYLDAVDRQLKSSTTTMEFFAGMTSLHPECINPGVLWSGACTLLSGD